MIDVSELMSDPDFCQPFSVLRSTGVNGPGGWQAAEATLDFYGPTQPADATTLQMVPEADRVYGARLFWAAQPIYETRTASQAGAAGISDVLIWRGQQFRVHSVWPWIDGGFFKALCVRMKGA